MNEPIHILPQSVLIVLIATFPPLLIAGMAWNNSRESRRQTQSLKKELLEIHLLINSRLDQLLNASNAISHAAGIVLGRKIEHEASKAIGELAAGPQAPSQAGKVDGAGERGCVEKG